VRVELDPAAPRILGDTQQLRQVIHNLLQNAQDATEGRPVREVVLRTQWNEASRRVRLVVQDSGAGFPEHILKRAFEPYVTTKVKGTGLGLAVVKKIADEHGARIDLKNRVENGLIQGAQVSLSFGVAN
jgi:nitrogen fixation/metabolism regulation signal transduction histidine kinase